MRSTRRHKLASLAALAVCSCGALAACGGPETAPPATAPLIEPTAAPAAVISRGKAVFVEKACQACHIIKGFDETIGLVGPELTTVYADAQTIIQSAAYKSSQGKAATPAEYLLESVLDPNAYIAPKCPTADCQSNLMIQDFMDTITPADLDALIAYLVTLK